MIIVGIFSWLLVGALVGFIASKLVNLNGDEPLVGIGCAVGGALVGAVIFVIVSGHGVLGFDPWALGSAAAGAIVAVVVYHAIRSRSISKDSGSIRRSY